MPVLILWRRNDHAASAWYAAARAAQRPCVRVRVKATTIWGEIDFDPTYQPHAPGGVPHEVRLSRGGYQQLRECFYRYGRRGSYLTGGEGSGYVMTGKMPRDALDAFVLAMALAAANPSLTPPPIGPFAFGIGGYWQTTRKAGVDFWCGCNLGFTPASPLLCRAYRLAPRTWCGHFNVQCVDHKAERWLPGSVSRF